MIFLPKYSGITGFYPAWIPSGGTTPEPGKLFFLNTPPKKPGAEYVLLPNGIIEADKIIMA